MNITVNDAACYVCGNIEGLTIHHAIPKQLKPINNVHVPICEKCHIKIHEVDFAQVTSYMYKIMKTINTSKNTLIHLNKIIERKLEPDYVK